MQHVAEFRVAVDWLPHASVYENWCFCETTGHSCVNVAAQSPSDAHGAEDVLEDPGFLVERLFDEERVVGDLERLAAGGRAPLALRRCRGRRA